MTADLIALHGRGLGGGVTEGEALVTREAIAGWGGIDQRSGTIIESGHELVGQSIAGKILIFPAAKGSSGWSGVLHMTRLEGCGPKAMVFNVMNTKIALAVVVAHVPSVTGLDQDPTAAIRTGDLVRVDGDRGVIEILKRKDDNADAA
jgi:hypothetical protein